MIKKLLSLVFFLCHIFALTEVFANATIGMASLQANNIVYSKNYESITASGNAQLLFEGKKLFASKIIYLKKGKKIIATGKVIFKDSNGDIYNFDYLASDLGFSNVFATNIKGRSKKVLAWSADEGFIKQSENKKIVKNFIFSPCINCSNDIIKDRLLWQIHAEELEVDDNHNEIILKKAILDFLGRPILYLPYISLPSSKAKPKSGFLKPNVDISREMGLRVEVPYYFKIAPNMDATFIPVFSTKIPTLYKLEFRHLLENGQYQVDSSFINQKNSKQERELSSNIKINGDFKGRLFDRNINYGVHINKLFDESKTYLKKYHFSNEDILNSCIYVNNQLISSQGKSHFISLEALFFQDLRPDYNTEITPNALPLIRYKQLYPIEFMNTKMELHSAFYNIVTRSQNHDTRLMNDINFSNQIITKGGHEFNIKNGIYTYLHQYNNINAINKNYINHVNIIPYSQIRWEYEMLASSYKDGIIIEPVASLMITPNKFFSQETELLEIRKSNFLTPNRFLDWESSDLVSRFDYGLNFFLKNTSIDALNIFLGSSLYMKNHQAANKKKYNYILIASLQLNQDTFIVNRVWFDQKNFEIVQHEIDSIMKFNKLDLGLSYTYKSQVDDRLFPQEVSGYIDFNFYQKWWLHLDAKVKLNSQKFSSVLNLDDKRKLLKDGIGLTYKDDCLKIDFAINRDHMKLKDLKPSVTYVIKIGVPIFSKL
ncbi:MAG: hypothetical protein MTP17_01475 [Candidatus Midichloria sp.]|nr:MAG: hypothetical protein MTP17_01475 [Candidatus Midichloria sp.]